VNLKSDFAAGRPFLASSMSLPPSEHRFRAVAEDSGVTGSQFSSDDLSNLPNDPYPGRNRGYRCFAFSEQEPPFRSARKGLTERSGCPDMILTLHNGAGIAFHVRTLRGFPARSGTIAGRFVGVYRDTQSSFSFSKPNTRKSFVRPSCRGDLGVIPRNTIVWAGDGRE